MSLLPSTRSDSESTQDGSFRLLDIDDEEADAVFDALSSQTTRTMLSALYRTPSTPSELAEQTDTSVQNAMYHLEKLEGVGLVRVVETRYSARGKEMRVYAPSEHPAVVFLGTEERKSGLVARLKRLLGAIGVLGLVGLADELPDAVQQSVSSHTLSPPAALVAAAGVVTALVVSRGSAADSESAESSSRRTRTINPMTRKTLLITVTLLVGVCMMPVAIAYSPAVSGTYTTSTAPAGTSGSAANAGVPQVADETVTVVVTGGDADVRASVSRQLTATLRERGATVERADRITDVSGSLFAVHLSDGHVDTGPFTLTPSANLTAYFTYVESGDASVAESVLTHEQTADGGPPIFRTELDGRVAVGSFSFERGTHQTIDTLNTIKRGGSDAETFKRDVGAAIANESVHNAFAERLWT
ncbi:helix-turn-helix domain-containing protein [Haloarcula sp. S1CR25-12]|uniref:Helix-turn-helix domain-containing protein n=1 Tax=Haloarcula saliterrae TaxID=2950534 RepID=A0ABU2FDG1_9EURY|nr:helix-turn-helix domain-containing protein [Haloarcula sp. S1CR25-12]MDS0260295.1 helix-turn-helix domain-containing protein [Haloarcula sp. S1CR25-12]